jgi:hypothetical protein
LPAPFGRQIAEMFDANAAAGVVQRREKGE